MKYLLVLFCLVFSQLSSAQLFYTQNLPVSDISLGGDSLSGFRVKLEVMEDTNQNCNIDNWYMYPYDSADPNYNAVYSTLLASKISGSNIGFQITGCVTVNDRTYPRITHVYVCDTGLCD